MTPPSVRFLGRKVYLAAVIILVSAMRQGPTPRRVRELSARFGADGRTIARWQVFWRELFPQTHFWKVARARLEPVVTIVALPYSLVNAFLRRRDPSDGLGAAASLPRTDHDPRSPADRGLTMSSQPPAEDVLRPPRSAGVQRMSQFLHPSCEEM